MGAATEISEHPEAEVLSRARIPEGQVLRLKSAVVGQRPTPHPAPLSRQDPHSTFRKRPANDFSIRFLPFYRPSGDQKVKVKEKSGLENGKVMQEHGENSINTQLMPEPDSI
jgi:hypothetical protein